MGFFGSLFGNDQRDDLVRNNAKAQKILKSSETTARAQMNQGFDEQLGSLQTGYTGATGNLNSGYDRARGDLTGAYGSAESAIGDQLAYSKELLNPYIQSGNAAQERYNTALGLNGQGSAEQFYDEYAASDPYRQLNEDMANQALMRLANANGQSGSGRTALAVSRANLERGSTDLNAYLDRLAGQGQRGGQYASTLSGYANTAGANIASLRSGLGDRLASNEVDRGRGLAELDYGYEQDRGNVQAGRGAANANLTYGVGQQLAGNRINLGNAVADTRGIGINNLLGLGATVIGGMTPGAKGISAFGNIKSGVQSLWS